MYFRFDLLSSRKISTAPYKSWKKMFEIVRKEYQKKRNFALYCVKQQGGGIHGGALRAEHGTISG
jgi:hypothetical protein